MVFTAKFGREVAAREHVQVVCVLNSVTPCTDITAKRAAAEHLRHVLYYLYIPFAEIAVKRGGASEHSMHVRYFLYIPFAEIVVIRCGASEHSMHVLYIIYIPFAEIAVKRGGASEHSMHVRYILYIPFAEIAVERKCLKKCRCHAFNFCCIPATDISIKITRTVERSIHRLRCIGIRLQRGGQQIGHVLVEGAQIRKHVIHVCAVHSANLYCDVQTPSPSVMYTLNCLQITLQCIAGRYICVDHWRYE